LSRINAEGKKWAKYQKREHMFKKTTRQRGGEPTMRRRGNGEWI